MEEGQGLCAFVVPDPWVDRLPFCPLYTARIGFFSIRGSVCPEFGHLVPPPGLLEGTSSDPRQALDVRECHAGKGHLQECRCLRSPKNGVWRGLMWVPADSHPHGVPKHLVEPGGCAKQGTVASHLHIANSPCPKRCPYSRASWEGPVSVKLWQIPSFVDVSKGFTTLHRVSVGTRPACLPCLSQVGPCLRCWWAERNWTL